MKSIFMLDINLLHHHPQNPRKEIGDIEELTESIKKKGILQNLTVVERPNCYEGEGYYVVIGNRRLEAAKAAGLIQLPCAIAHMTEKEQLETMLLENMQRVDLTVKEQADGFQMMLDLGSDVDEISAKTGFAKSTIYHRLNVAKLDADILEKKQVTMQELIMLEKIKSVEKRNEILNRYGGTTSFAYMVDQAAGIEKRKERADKIIKVLEEKGIHESEKYENYWNAGVKTVQIIWLTEDAEDPAEFKTGEFYIVNSDRITIANEEVQSEEKSQAEIEAEREREEKKKRISEMDRLERKINREAKAIIITYATSKEEVELTEEDKKAIVLYSINRAKDIKTIIEDTIKGYDEESENLRKQMIETILSKSAITILLVASIGYYGTIVSLYNSWSAEYRGTEREVNFVNVLKKIGLKLSADEEEFVNGTSPIFTPTE